MTRNTTQNGSCIAWKNTAVDRHLLPLRPHSFKYITATIAGTLSLLQSSHSPTGGEFV